MAENRSMIRVGRVGRCCRIKQREGFKGPSGSKRVRPLGRTWRALNRFISKMPPAANIHMPIMVTIVCTSVRAYTNLKLKTDRTALFANTIPHPTATLKTPYTIGLMLDFKLIFLLEEVISGPQPCYVLND